jgi:hypothetical protein
MESIIEKRKREGHVAGEADSADIRLSTSRASENPEPCADDGLAL